MAFIINMRIFKTILLFALVFVSLTNAAPSSFLRLEHRTLDEDSSTTLDDVDIPVSSTTSAPEQDIYDQRQNGTENYRIHVKGLVVLFAPVETILLAGGSLGGGSLGGANELLSGLAGSLDGKPKPKPDETTPITSLEQEHVEEPKTDLTEKKSAIKSHLGLVSLLAPLLKRVSIY